MSHEKQATETVTNIIKTLVEQLKEDSVTLPLLEPKHLLELTMATLGRLQVMEGKEILEKRGVSSAY